MNFLVSFVTLAAVVAADVVELTPDNFDSVVNGDKHVLVKFFAPWCGHCKAMAEDYIAASNAFTKFPEIVIAEVDADAHNSLGGRFGVSGFPTLKWFPKGSTEGEEYSAGRGLDDIVNFVNDKAGVRGFVVKPHSDVTVLTPRNFDVYVNKNVGMLIEFYAPWCGHCKKLAPIYEKVATTFVNEETVVIANVDADAEKMLASPFGVTGFPTLKWIPVDCHAADCAEEYEGAREGENLVSFVNKKMSTQRVFGGRLNDEAGRNKELDAMVSKFMAATDKKAVIAEAETLVNDADATFYVKVMNKFVTLADEGEAWLAKEVKRLADMLDKRLSANKKDEFTKRLNIVKQFHDEL